MHWIVAAVLLTDAFPLVLTWRANRRTALAHAALWGVLAWAAWLVAELAVALGSGWSDAAFYAALCLTGAAGVAVLGARRPGVGAWNFVVIGLLAVLALPLFEGLDKLRESPLRLLFVAMTLTVALANHAPTRLGVPALMVAAGCGSRFLQLAAPDNAVERFVIGTDLLLALAPWLGLALLQMSKPGDSQVNRLWRSFRDRYGFVWGQRVREQFNTAAVNAGWPIFLGWRGLRGAGGELDEKALATLRAVLKRFGVDRGESEAGHAG